MCSAKYIVISAYEEVGLALTLEDSDNKSRRNLWPHSPSLGPVAAVSRESQALFGDSLVTVPTGVLRNIFVWRALEFYLLCAYP